MTYEVTRPLKRAPMHPGLVLEDAIEATGKTKVEIAGLLDISRQHLYDIIKGRKPITPNVAARIGKLMGNGSGVWLRMQAAYDTWHADHDIDVSHIPTLEAA